MASTLATRQKPNRLLALVTRISAASAAGRTAQDAWHQYLQATVNKSGTVADLEPLWLRSRIAALSGPTPPAGATDSDLWNSYLNTKGYSGSLQDKFNKWLISGTA